MTVHYGMPGREDELAVSLVYNATKKTQKHVTINRMINNVIALFRALHITDKNETIRDKL